MSTATDHPLRLGLFLAAAAALSACVLAFTAGLTKEQIAGVQAAKVTDALRQVLPSFDNDPAAMAMPSPDDPGIVFYPATLAGVPVGFAGTAASPLGYGGAVKVMASLDPQGRIVTVIVTEQKETPGLGTVVTDRRRQKTLAEVLGGAKPEEGLPPNPVLDQFAGRDCAGAPWTVRKDGGDIDQITGATVSTRAVADAVSRLAQAFATHREALLARAAASPSGGETASEVVR